MAARLPSRALSRPQAQLPGAASHPPLATLMITWAIASKAAAEIAMRITARRYSAQRQRHQRPSGRRHEIAFSVFTRHRRYFNAADGSNAAALLEPATCWPICIAQEAQPRAGRHAPTQHAPPRNCKASVGSGMPLSGRWGGFALWRFQPPLFRGLRGMTVSCLSGFHQVLERSRQRPPAASSLPSRLPFRSYIRAPPRTATFSPSRLTPPFRTTATIFPVLGSRITSWAKIKFWLMVLRSKPFRRVPAKNAPPA
jgi:hypothetical protein